MTFEEFVATRRQPTEDEIRRLEEEVDIKVSREMALFYGPTEEPYLIEIREDGFYPHAWWYLPIRHETLVSAEDNLHDWFLEFN